MSVSAQASSANFSAKPCSKCGAKELQRRPRTFSQKLLALYPYVCLNCTHRENKFRLNLGTIVRVLLLVGVPGALGYFAVHPTWFHRTGEDFSQNAADALSSARTSSGGLSTFEQMMLRKPRATMDNASILRLWKANVGTYVILQLIHTNGADYDVSANAVIDLKQAGVDQSIILAMIDATNGNH